MSMEREGKSEATRSESKVLGECYTVYAVVDCLSDTYLGAVYEVKIEQGGKVVDGVVTNDETNKQAQAPILGDPVCQFLKRGEEVPKFAFLECARFHTCSELYILPGTGDLYHFGETLDDIKPRKSSGFVIDTKSTKPSCIPLVNPPESSKTAGIVISAYNKLYHLAHPLCILPLIPKPSFECYDPNNHKWKPLPSWEYSIDQNAKRFSGYAVCHGCILVSLHFPPGGTTLYRVFHIDTEEWYGVKDAPDFAFRGRAVVVGDTIYALAIAQCDVMTFSLRMCSNAAGDIYYSLGTISLLRGVESVPPPNHFWGTTTNYLVHLGNLVFCLVETGFNSIYDGCQHLCITTFQIEGRNIKTLDSAVRGVAVHKFTKLKLNFCFNPDCEDFEPKEKEESPVASHLREQPKVEKENPCTEEDKVVSINEDEAKGKMTTLDEHLVTKKIVMARV